MHPPPVDRTAQRLRSAGPVVVVVVVALQTVAHLANTFGPELDALDVHAEGTIFSALAAVTITALAGLCVLAGRRGAVELAPARVLAGLLGFLAVDEFFVVHERVGDGAVRLLGLSEGWDSVLWPLLYLPLLGVVFLQFLAFSRLAPREVGGLAVIGLRLLVAAVLLEAVSAPFSTPATYGGLVHAFEGAVEEGLELGGWGLLVVALLTWCSSCARSPSPTVAAEGP